MKRKYIVLSLAVLVVLINSMFTHQGCSPKATTESEEQVNVVLEQSINASMASIPLDLTALTQKAADHFSWQSFIALNWPADTSTCQADTSQGMSILTGTGPVVWETYLTSDQVFVAAPATPDAWCTTDNETHRLSKLPAKVQALARQTGVYRFLSHISKSPHDLDQAVGGPLVDQNGRFARYEVRMNEDEYKYIMAHQLWDTVGQRKFVQDSIIKMPAGPSSYGPVGAMEFKAAWKVLGKGDDASKFYKIKAIVYNTESGEPSPGENPVTLGLVGLHLIHKTATQGNWVWSTFEHVDNLTKSFFNPACDSCPVNQQVTKTPYTELDKNGNPVNQPTQVTRVNPVDDPFVDSLNMHFQSLLQGSVWANYQLVSTQWMFFEDMLPQFLANSVQETYVQGPNPPSYGGFPLGEDEQYYQDSLYQPFAPGISASCMGCHYVATLNISGAKSDFSFILGNAQ